MGVRRGWTGDAVRRAGGGRAQRGGRGLSLPYNKVESELELVIVGELEDEIRPGGLWRLGILEGARAY